MRRIDKEIKPFLNNLGYGKGTNYTTDLVSSLILQYTDELVKNLTIPDVSNMLKADDINAFKKYIELYYEKPIIQNTYKEKNRNITITEIDLIKQYKRAFKV